MCITSITHTHTKRQNESALRARKKISISLALLVLLEDHHAEECYAAEEYPVGNENHYTESLVFDVVAAPDQ
jgi:hypothetical protein